MERRTGKDSMGHLRARLATLAGAAVLLAMAVAPAGAAAEGTPESVLGPRMSLVFTKDTAQVVGAKALVLVKCLGSQTGTCVGTVSLDVQGDAHKVPFSVLGGHKQSLVVPLGSGQDRPARAAARKAVAVASTVQPLGPCHEAERTLRLK
ncbi:MAG TPA: hypothetical protein VGO24_08695 [Solirubrobacterales bacterium]|jgi:hypothetical protein|nr:hypothetical protein [Solirubrobacterales bacterium]